MAKSTISMAIFNSYVSLPEGNPHIHPHISPDARNRRGEPWWQPSRRRRIHGEARRRSQREVAQHTQIDDLLGDSLIVWEPFFLVTDES
jgi:hypothetical protein